MLKRDPVLYLTTGLLVALIVASSLYVGRFIIEDFIGNPIVLLALFIIIVLQITLSLYIKLVHQKILFSTSIAFSLLFLYVSLITIFYAFINLLVWAVKKL